MSDQARYVIKQCLICFYPKILHPDKIRDLIIFKLEAHETTNIGNGSLRCAVPVYGGVRG
jgi:hypothetical protein